MQVVWNPVILYDSAVCPGFLSSGARILIQNYCPFMAFVVKFLIFTNMFVRIDCVIDCCSLFSCTIFLVNVLILK